MSEIYEIPTQLREEKEKNTIKEVAERNENLNIVIDKIIIYKELKVRINDMTVFRGEKRENKLISFSGDHFTKGFEEMFQDFGIRVAYKTKQSLYSLLLNPKEKRKRK